MLLFIEDPEVERQDGKHFTLAYEIPKNTTGIEVKGNPDSAKFTLTCYLKDGGNQPLTELTHLIATNIVPIEFKEHKQRTWYDRINNQESSFSDSCKWTIQVLVIGFLSVGAAWATGVTNILNVLPKIQISNDL